MILFPCWGKRGAYPLRTAQVAGFHLDDCTIEYFTVPYSYRSDLSQSRY